MDTHPTLAMPVDLPAADGYGLKGHCWRHEGPANATRPMVLINPATSVCARYYARFAEHLHRHGFDVLSYDYRGIGLSRPPRLRGFEAGWIDWGRLDVEAALQWIARQAPGQPIHVVGHSVGGFLIGLAPSGARVSRIFTVGAQYAHWKDYAPERRWRMWLKWHGLMPALTACCGYFPGRRLGWLEDTPRGVVRDWTARALRFEDIWRRGSARLDAAERQALVQRFARIRADLLALSLSDDEFGTVAAVQRLLAYFEACPRTHLHLRPQAVGAQAIGHFAFFHSRFEHSLWPLAREWLQHARVPAALAGELRHTGPAPAQAEGESSAA